MIRNRCELDEAGCTERVRVVQVGDGDLDVDPVLRGQSRNGRRADVVDAQRPLAESRADPACKPREIAGPPVGVRHDDDA